MKPKLSNSIILDFETRSLEDLPKVGRRVYIKDKSTKAIILTYKLPGKKVVAVVGTKRIKKACDLLHKKYFSKGYFFVAHNVFFDLSLFEKITGKTLDNFVCTALLSVYMGGARSLKDCSSFWDLKDVKNVNGLALIKLFSIPYAKFTDKRRRTLFGSPFKIVKGFAKSAPLFDMFVRYAVDDTKACFSLFKLLHHEWKNIVKYNVLDDYIRESKRPPLKIDLKRCNILLKLSEQLKEVTQRKARKISKNKDFNLASPKIFLAYINSFKGIYFEDTKGDTIENALRECGKYYPKDLKHMLQLKLAYPKSVCTKFENFRDENHKGFSFDNYVLFGAGVTGRYTSYGVNFLNLPRGFKRERVQENMKLIKKGQFIKKHGIDSYKELKGMMRSLLIAPKGKKFVGGDFSQIELRLLFLQCGEKKALKRLFEGFDYYVHFAKRVFGVKKVTETQRYVAKRAVLAFGYGLFPKGIKNILVSDGINISEAEAKSLFDLYHKEFPLVRKYWDTVGNEYPRLRLRLHKRPLNFNKGKVLSKGQASQRHNNPFYQYEFMHPKGYRTALTGGGLVGCMTQGLASELLKYVDRRLTKKGYIIPLIFHDEVFSIQDEDFDVSQFKKDLSKAPKWLRDVGFKTIDNEVWESKRYYK